MKHPTEKGLFMTYAPLNYALSGGSQDTIGVTGESVEQFEVMSFFERRNNFLRFFPNIS